MNTNKRYRYTSTLSVITLMLLMAANRSYGCENHMMNPQHQHLERNFSAFGSEFDERRSAGLFKKRTVSKEATNMTSVQKLDGVEYFPGFLKTGITALGDGVDLNVRHNSLSTKSGTITLNKDSKIIIENGEIKKREDVADVDNMILIFKKNDQYFVKKHDENFGSYYQEK